MKIKGKENQLLILSALSIATERSLDEYKDHGDINFKRQAEKYSDLRYELQWGWLGGVARALRLRGRL